MTKRDSLIPTERIAGQIYVIRGEKVMLDSDLAVLYGVKTKALNQAVTRNRERFPEDFMFRLSWEEYRDLKVTICDLKISEWSQNRKYTPRAFSEQARRCSPKPPTGFGPPEAG